MACREVGMWLVERWGCREVGMWLIERWGCGL